MSTEESDTESTSSSVDIESLQNEINQLSEQVFFIISKISQTFHRFS